MSNKSIESIKTKTEMIAAVNAKLAEYYSVTVDKVKMVGEYYNKAEEKDALLNVVTGKIISIVALSNGTDIRKGANILKVKNKDEYSWDDDGDITKELFKPISPIVESIQEKATKWAKSIHKAIHVDIIDINNSDKDNVTCRIYAYTPTVDLKKVHQKEFVVYVVDGKTEGKEVV